MTKARLQLPTVTLCAAASTNVAATVQALQRSLDLVDFTECLLFTDAEPAISDNRIKIIHIERLSSAVHYSNFMLRELPCFVHTEHCLIVQWDGFVLNPERWENLFLEYDYIGAVWPQFSDGYNVGNGGFSLRSRRLLTACLSPNFEAQHPEDVAICRVNRPMLEREHRILFPPPDIAQRFSCERNPPLSSAFGFHGAFNMIAALGTEPFWKLYTELDDKRTVFADYATIKHDMTLRNQILIRKARFTFAYMHYRFKRLVVRIQAATAVLFRASDAR